MRVTPAQARIGPKIWLSGSVQAIAQRKLNRRTPGTDSMANTPQAKKRARQNEKRYAVNKARRSRIRTTLRKVEEAIASGNYDAAVAALREAQPALMKGVTKGVLHKNTASRKISRLASRVKALSN